MMQQTANYFQEKMFEAVCQEVPRAKKSPYSLYPPGSRAPTRYCSSMNGSREHYFGINT